MKNQNQKFNIGILFFPFASSTTNIFLYSLLEILNPLSKNIFAIYGGVFPDNKIPPNINLINIGLKLHHKKDIYPIWWSTILWIIKNILIQIKMSIEIIKLNNKIDIVICCGTSYYLPVLLLAKILNKKTAILAWGLGAVSNEKRGFYISTYFLKFVDRIIFNSVDKIVVESESAVKFLGLNKFTQKVISNGARHIDIKLFKQTRELDDRPLIVAYIGRLIPGKGIINFIYAIPLVLKEKPEVKFLIGGDGILNEQVKNYINENKLNNTTTLTGWIAHSELPTYLNKIKLLVLPSYSEGLPTIVLEAMACGTPVLATPVGGIPDVINEGKTGFIIKSNTAANLAEHIILALNCKKNNNITQDAKHLIQNEYEYERVVQNYKKILTAILE